MSAQSLEDLKILRTLYRLKALGYSYCNPIAKPQNKSHTHASSLQELTKQVERCRLCDLSKSRTQSLAGSGREDAKLLFVDYAISPLEDSSGEYYAGRSGKMLEDMITKVLGLHKSEVYLTHAIKCKPPQSKTSLKPYEEACKGYLQAQIKLIAPKVIVALGAQSFAALSDLRQEEFERMRGHAIGLGASKLIAIHHPRHLLRNPNLKKVAYGDLLTIKSYL